MRQEANPPSSGPTAPARNPLQWPPPGLEHLHGAVWPVNMMFGVGGALMVLPMLLPLSFPQPFSSAGPFGDAWWVPGVLSLAGVLILLAGLVQASHLGFIAARGAANGYDARTLADVACDATRDSGFLLQGLRRYGSLDGRKRRRLLDARIVAAFGTGAAMLWIPVSFTIGVVLAARGVIHGVGPLWPLIFLPMGVLLCIGLCARGFDEAITRKAHRDWCRNGAGNGHARLEAAEWMRARAERTRSGDVRAASPRASRVSAFGFGVLALAVPLPVIMLAFLSVAGPMIVKVGTPRMGSTIPGRIARTEILRPYALPADPSISPTDAGESLQVLGYAGWPNASRAPVLREPVRAIAEPWIPADAPESLLPDARLPYRVWEDHQPLTKEEQASLERMAAHPGHAEIARLARAGSADIVATRFYTARFGETNVLELPIYRFGGLLGGAHAHVALGLLAAQQGDLETAETRFREVISTGLLLVREGHSSLDLVIGSMVAQEGANALRLFYEATGRDADADGLRLALEAVDRTQSAEKSIQPGTTGSLQVLVSIAENTDLPAGIRWESLRHARITAGCQSTSAIVFGQDDSYDEWLQKVNGSLVRFPSDQALFDLLGSNRMPTDHMSRSVRLVRGLYGLTFGTAGPATWCAGLATSIAAAY